jgi:hypothetical protein
LQTSAPALSEAQRRALAIGDEERWQIIVEAADGTRLQLRRGHPERVLILRLGELPPDDYTDLYPRAA